MNQEISFSQFRKRYPNDDSCFEEIVNFRYPDGMNCTRCKKVTTHYRVKGRPSYTCKLCRKHIHPLAGTIFEKTSTSLRLWFYAIFLLTHTNGAVTAAQLQRELGVTYKTAWRMHKQISNMRSKHAEKDKVFKWVFFKRFEISVVEKEETSF